MKTQSIKFPFAIFLLLAITSCQKFDLPKFHDGKDGKKNNSLLTQEVQSVTSTGATVTGINLNTVQKNAVLGIVWSTSNKVPTVDDNIVKVTPVVGPFSVSLNGLKPSTTYYVRTFFASNEVSPGKYADLRYGNVLTFKTKEIPGSSPIFLTWNDLGRNIQWNNNKGIRWDGVKTGAPISFANQQLVSGKEVVARVPDVINDVWSINLAKTNNTSNFNYGVLLNTKYYEIIGSTSTSTGVIAAVGDLIKLKYSGTTITIERSTNSGSSWTVLATAPFNASGAYYIGFFSSVGGPSEIYIQ